MKRIILSLLLLCAASALLYAQDTINVFFDSNWAEIPNKAEAVYYRKAFRASNNDWAVNDYFMSNKIQMTGTFKSKKLTVKNGHFVYYFENGNKSSEGDYVNNQNEGSWNFWFDDGKKKSEGKFTEGEKVGIWNYWYADGIMKYTETYQKSGSFTGEGFHKNGITSFKGNFINNRPQGTWMYWNSDGRIILTGNYKNGLRDGDWIRTFRDGEIKIHYKDGAPEGKQLGGIVRKE